MRGMWLAAVLTAIVAVFVGFVSLTAERPVQPTTLGEGGYDITAVLSPVADGVILRFLSVILASDWFGPLLCRVLLNDNDFHLVRQLAEQTSGHAVHWPMVRLPADEYTAHETHAASAEVPAKVAKTVRRGVLDYHEAYKAGSVTPVDEARRSIASARDVGSQLRCFVEVLEESALRDAQASAQRWARGAPLGMLDGVPFVTKDEIAVAGTVLGDGLVREGRAPEGRDDLVVARLRAAGAVLIGKTVMTTFGTSPLGWNPDFQGPYNAYNTSHYSGGSSAGTATAISAGIVPVGIGLDGGGSIRLPAAFSGVLGLAPTFGRVPFDNEGAEVMSVIKIGPLASDAASLAIVYSILGQPEPQHHYTEVYGGAGPPPPHLAGFNRVRSLSGVRLGVFTPHFEDASPSIVSSCRDAVESLRALGAEVIEVNIPHLKALSLSHALVIGSEMGSMHDSDWWQYRDHLMPETKINLGLFRSFQAKEYVSAMRLRGWAMRWMKKHVFSRVDAYVSPASGTTAPFLSDGAKPYGESNAALVMKVMKFIFMCNLLGNPGVSVPVGYEEGTSLPLAIHFMADHWQEAVLLRIANALQAQRTEKLPAHWVKQ
eukprot:TRINITY_DN10782_c0_g1_i1.p1 TRINITY_DN10782_c0_g1~~TRINITY_DN10782_c0_g1_i1.p1  ORF type:complete len:600 (+),score=87.31 TRINITY_DN10782_c0_g1_i1:86-1885(+)